MNVQPCITGNCENTADGRDICDECANRLTDDIDWLSTHLTDIEYRLNPANKPHEQPGAANGKQPPAVNERLFNLLYETDRMGRDGLRRTLIAWLTATTPTRDHSTRTIRDMLGQIHADRNLLDEKPTHVFAPEAHRLRTDIENLLDEKPADTRIYGNCPNRHCNKPLKAQAGSEHIHCPHCDSTWTASFLRTMQRQRIIASDSKATMRSIRAKLKTIGIHVNANTMRTWAHRGKLRPASRTRSGEPLYRLGDVAVLAITATENDVRGGEEHGVQDA